MTRELKLALIVGVTLVLGVAVLISDHLAAKRRPPTVTEVAVQPAMMPPPAVVPTVVLPPAPIAVGTEPEAGVRPHDSPVVVAIKTPGVSGSDQPAEDAKPVEREPRPFGPQPLIARQTSEFDDGHTERLPAAPRTHVVVDGDSAYRIAKAYLGDGGEWKRLADANPKGIGPEGQLRIGTVLVIPGTATPAGRPPVREVPVIAKASKPEPKATLAKADTTKADAAKSVKNKAKQYTVRPGDTLTGIARRELGSSARADEIAELNKGVIKDPDTLPLGAAIRLPSG